MKSNGRRLNILMMLIAVSNVVYGLIRGMMFRNTFSMFDKVSWVILNMIYAFPFYMIWAASRPAFDNEGNLIHGGEDISKGGVLEYAHDVIYVCIATQIGMTVTRWAMPILLVIPGYAAYFAFTSGILPPSASSGADLGDSQNESEALGALSRKERRKAERQSRKQR